MKQAISEAACVFLLEYIRLTHELARKRAELLLEIIHQPAHRRAQSMGIPCPHCDELGVPE